jgi:predicted molibdopterin-dependent oxidoreductase YjgC
MFKRLDRHDSTEIPSVTIHFEGRAIVARQGDTVAGALLAAGVDRFRKSAISGTERGPYCLMGACFECLVEIDGNANQQACLRTVEDGMRIALQDGPVALESTPVDEEDAAP